MAKKNSINKTTMLGLGDMNLEHLYRLGDELIIADHFDVKRAFPPYFRTAMPVCIILKKGYLRGRCNLMDIDAVAKGLMAPRSANMVLLGMAARHLSILAPEDLRNAIRTVFARKGDKVVEDNLKAFDAGYEGIQ